MKLENIAQFGFFVVDHQGNVHGQAGKVLPAKYGEAMANRAAHATMGPQVFEAMHKDEKVLGTVNEFDLLAAARDMLATQNEDGIFIDKHTGPCGATAFFADPVKGYQMASQVNEVARFGGIIGVRRVTLGVAEALIGKQGKKKVDGIVALEYDADALQHLLIAPKSPPPMYRVTDPHFDILNIDFQPGINGWTLQERIAFPEIQELELARGQHMDLKDITKKQILFAARAVNSRYSNAIGFVESTSEGAVMVGLSGGASDRITAAYQALENAVGYYLFKHLQMPKEEIPEVGKILYMVSDGFFPDTAALRVGTEAEQIELVKRRLSNYPYITQEPHMLDKSGRTVALLAEEDWGSSDPREKLVRKMNYIADRLRIHVPLVLNPGGSKGQDQVADYAEEKGITMLIPLRDGKPMRFFKHTPQSAYLIRAA